MHKWGIVQNILEETSNRQVMIVQLLSKESIKAMYFINRYHTNEYCRVGDFVNVNVAGLDLKLGTGGYGFVSARLDKNELDLLNKVKHESLQVEHLQVEQHKSGMPQQQDYPKVESIGHTIKLRYTGQQTPVCAIEEEGSPTHSLFQQPFSLDNRPVLVGELHSMLPVVAALIYQWQPDAHLAYIMDDQACLHLPFSNHVRDLQAKMHVTTITSGQATGGDVECINLHTGLEAAVKHIKADHILVTQGPGVIGTRTPRGFSGMGLSNWIHTVYTNGGQPVVIPRIQFEDGRHHHHGLSRHTWYPLLHHTLVSAFIPYPVNDNISEKTERQWELYKLRVLVQQFQDLCNVHIPVPIPLSSKLQDELHEALNEYDKPVRTMGKDMEWEPFFFYGVAAAFDFYRTMFLRYDETRNRVHEGTGEFAHEFRRKNDTDRENI